MSRNLCATVCVHCGDNIAYLEAPRPITEKERGPYDEFDGMLIAESECPSCLAQYMAWIDDSATEQARQYGARRGQGYPHFDLSYFSTFNDEPGPDDGPRYEIQIIRHRVCRTKEA